MSPSATHSMVHGKTPGAAAAGERIYGLLPGSAEWWFLLSMRLAWLAVYLLMAVFVAHSTWLRILLVIVAGGLFALGLRQLRGLEPSRIRLHGYPWEDLTARLPPALRQRGFDVRTSPSALEAELRDTLGARFAFDARREDGAIVLQGQRATVRWARRALAVPAGRMESADNAS